MTPLIKKGMLSGKNDAEITGEVYVEVTKDLKKTEYSNIDGY